MTDKDAPAAPDDSPPATGLLAMVPSVAELVRKCHAEGIYDDLRPELTSLINMAQMIDDGTGDPERLLPALNRQLEKVRRRIRLAGDHRGW